MGSRGELGLTLIELLTTTALLALILVMSASALRYYWFSQALDSGADEAATGLRRIQSATTSESHPVVYGLRVAVGSDQWDFVRYDPRVTSGPQCSFSERNDFSGSLGAHVEVSAVTVDDTSEATVCRTDLGLSEADRFFFFFPRGNATPGSFTLLQPNLGTAETVTVTGITGRVTRT